MTKAQEAHYAKARDTFYGTHQEYSTAEQIAAVKRYMTRLDGHSFSGEAKNIIANYKQILAELEAK